MGQVGKSQEKEGVSATQRALEIDQREVKIYSFQHILHEKFVRGLELTVTFDRVAGDSLKKFAQFVLVQMAELEHRPETNGFSPVSIQSTLMLTVSDTVAQRYVL